MEKQKLLIADPCDDFRNALADALQSTYRVRTAADGVQCQALLQTFLPDILMLDLMLPGLDGITLLQKAAQEGIRPMVLATTRYLSDYTLSALERLGVSYVMVKPCDIGAAVSRIADLSQPLNVPAPTLADPQASICGILLRLGISSKLRGYRYLREAIALMATDPGQSITKELYPAVAAATGATAAQVERSIRSAVGSAWEHHDRQIWQLYFPQDARGSIPRPTNAAFICRLADDLRRHCDLPAAS